MFKFSQKSLSNLAGVDETLVRVVLRARELSEVDFGVNKSVRTAQEQFDIWKRKASQLNGAPVGKSINGVAGTGVSKHQEGVAVDLAAYPGGKYSDDWTYYYQIGRAVQKAAQELGVAVRWGGVWDRALGDLSEDMKAEVAGYTARQRAKGKKAFLDGFHFELL